jgi:endonuclease-8
VPEGHTIHRLARDLDELRGGPLRASSPQGRFTEGAARLDGAALEGIEPHGKHLFLAMNTGDHLHVHLGMQGTWLRYDDPLVAARPQVRLRLATSSVARDLIAPSVCELLDDEGVRRVRAGLGPDPLRPDADVPAALAALASDSRAIGTVLLDQSVLAGVGNVFRNEALHAIGVDPRRPSRSTDLELLARLWDVLREMMAQAVEDGRIITVDTPDRSSIPESRSRRVYKQEHCRDCGSPVVTSTVGGRTAYVCPVEQTL